jgi:hypothetical protein
VIYNSFYISIALVSIDLYNIFNTFVNCLAFKITDRFL